MTDETDGDARSSLRALAHPLRLRILSLLTGTELSAAEVARELDVSHANASYHLRVLADAGEVVVAGEEKIRGGVAKRYRHPWEMHGRTGKPGAPVSDADRDTYVRALAEELVRRSRLRRPRTRQMITDAELWVSRETWRQVHDLVEQASLLVHAEAQPPRSPDTIHVNMTAVLFQMKETKQ
jgi:DNA-binding transcriptional ArsR family regulator